MCLIRGRAGAKTSWLPDMRSLASFFLALILTCHPSAGRSHVLFIAVDDLNDWIGCLGEGILQLILSQLRRIRGIPIDRLRIERLFSFDEPESRPVLLIYDFTIEAAPIANVAGRLLSSRVRAG